MKALGQYYAQYQHLMQAYETHLGGKYYRFVMMI